ncbi:MAG: pilin, partial [Candidatus Gracilibacteria bacterium]|nr:pilin [Candidatus Gracilibacteria bacterium]
CEASGMKAVAVVTPADSQKAAGADSSIITKTLADSPVSDSMKLAGADSVTAKEADAFIAAKDATAAAAKAGGVNTTGTKTGSATSGDSTTSTGEVIPPADNRYFEVKVQTPFSAAPVGSNTGADELKAKWKTDGYISCDKGEVDNKTCDYHCIYPSNGRILCENLSSGEAWRYYPSTDGKTGNWYQVIRGSDGIDILTTYTTLIYRWLAGFIGIAAVLLIVIGGIMISSAGANQEGMESGKKLITSALAGLTLLFVSSLILYTVNPDFFSQTKGVAEFEKEATVTSTTTPPATPSATTPEVVPAGTLTHAAAVSSLGSMFKLNKENCTLPNRLIQTNCTSLDGIRPTTIDGLKALQTSPSCIGVQAWTITGGTECSHAGNTGCTYAEAANDTGNSHGNGYKVDLRMGDAESACINSKIKNGSTFTENGFKYSVLKESDHWDLVITSA